MTSLTAFVTQVKVRTMNQRTSHSKDDKNNLNFVSINTGGHTARHAPNEDPQVQVPQKITGELKSEVSLGVAKASPNFKPITPPAKAMDKTDEKKIISENSTTVTDSEKTDTKE